MKTNTSLKTTDPIPIETKIRHADDSTGRVLTYHPTEKNVVLIQWDEDLSTQWVSTDMVTIA